MEAGDATPVTPEAAPAAPEAVKRRRKVAGTGAIKRRIVLIAFVFCLVTDLATKSWVFAGLPVPKAPVERIGEPINIVAPYLVFRRQVNPGVAFGIGRWLSPNQLTVIMLGAVGLVMWLIRATPSYDRAMLAGFGMIAGGAWGNIYDRLTFGVVRDFIDIQVPQWGFVWHTFNFADTWVVSGGILIVIGVIFAAPAHKPSTAPADASTPSQPAPAAPV